MYWHAPPLLPSRLSSLHCCHSFCWRWLKWHLQTFQIFPSCSPDLLPIQCPSYLGDNVVTWMRESCWEKAYVSICWSVFRYKKICTIYQRNLKLARIFFLGGGVDLYTYLVFVEYKGVYSVFKKCQDAMGRPHWKVLNFLKWKHWLLSGCGPVKDDHLWAICWDAWWAH